jgi:uncharacterized OB-fold protein
MVTEISIISTIVVAAATVMLAVLTGKYVCLTKTMVDEMKEAREPDIHVDFELPESILRLVIGNSGRSPAKNIRFEVVSDVDCIRSVHWKNKSGLSILPVFKTGISYLSPGRTLKFWAGFLEQKKETPLSKVFRILVRYENNSGKLFERDIAIDMSQYENVLYESFKDNNVAVANAIRDAEHSRRSHENRGGFFSKFFICACPVCGENVKPFARKCPHCGEWIKQEQKTGNKREVESTDTPSLQKEGLLMNKKETNDTAIPLVEFTSEAKAGGDKSIKACEKT